MKTQISALALLVWATLLGTNALPQVPSVNTTRSGQQLELGKPIEREFCVGDQHRYQIPLDAGQFARVLVTPKGPDTKETFFGPAGSKIISLDMGPVGGPETVSLIAEASGTHAIEVELNVRGNPNVGGNPFEKSK